MSTSLLQSLPNRINKNGPRAKRGSTGRARIVDEGLYLPGETSNYASTPDAVSLEVTDLDARVSLPSGWETSSTWSMFAKWQTSGQFSWVFQKTLTGNLTLFWSTDGTALSNISSSGVMPAGTNAARVTRVAASGALQFYVSSDDGATWTPHEGVRSTVAGGHFVGGTSQLSVGNNNAGAGSSVTGTIKWAQLRNGINGTIVASPDFEAAAIGSTKVADEQGNVWTVTSTSGIDTNDPLFLTHTGEHYVWAPGTAGNFIAGLASSGIIVDGALTAFDYRFDGNMPVSAGNSWLVCDWRTHLTVSVIANGTYQLRWQVAGGGSFPLASSSAGLFSFGVRQKIRVTGTMDGAWHIYTRASGDIASNDGWTLVESPLSPGPTSVDRLDGMTVLANRSDGGVQSFTTGIVYKTIWNWVSASQNITYTFDPSTQIDTSANPNSGQTTFNVFTVNRSATGLRTAVVTRPIILADGVDDRIQCAPADFSFTTGVSATAIQVYRAFDTGSGPAGTVMFNVRQSGSNFFRLLAYNYPGLGVQIAAHLSDGTTTAFASKPYAPFGQLVVAGMRYDATANTLEAFFVSGDGVLQKSTTASTVGLGALAAATTAYPMEVGLPREVAVPLIYAGASAWSDAQITAIAAQLLAGAYA